MDDIGVVVAFIGAEPVAVDPVRCENVVSFAKGIVFVFLDAVCMTVVSECGAVGFDVNV